LIVESDTLWNFTADDIDWDSHSNPSSEETDYSDMSDEDDDDWDNLIIPNWMLSEWDYREYLQNPPQPPPQPHMIAPVANPQNHNNFNFPVANANATYQHLYMPANPPDPQPADMVVNVYKAPTQPFAAFHRFLIAVCNAAGCLTSSLGLSM